MKFLLLILFFLTSCQNSDGTYDALKNLLSGEMTESKIASGLKEALKKGTSSAVSSLSKEGGYSKNALYRLAVPEKMKKVTSTMRDIGLGSWVDTFENKMNEAAEKAVQEAAPVFVDAITQMTLSDAKNILMGNDTAATDFFHQKTNATLKKKYMPIMQAKMEEIGLVTQFNKLLGRYNSIPFITKVSFTLEEYVTDEALKGLFGVLAETEKDIRVDPAARTTALLRSVFSQQDKK
jgi:hypothetical protein